MHDSQMKSKVSLWATVILDLTFSKLLRVMDILLTYFSIYFLVYLDKPYVWKQIWAEY